MNFLSVLAFPAARAAYRGHALTFVDPHPAPIALATKRFELMNVVVASKDAWRARQALQACPDTAIVRCSPMHKDARVKLEVRFPAGRGDTVIDRILSCLPNGQIGGIVAYAKVLPFAARPV
ncbi:hypothetical protein [Rhodoferax ferrireducens]|uniref:hypothetical protein n=1 Tax=Rhodoferax ferrireducens TaxID=192843 RepID=UPI000E0DFA9E|nr:hypothetical protein [Rhodoferax ferrireducens]